MILFTASYCTPCKTVKKYLQDNGLDIPTYTHDITDQEGMAKAKEFNVEMFPTLINEAGERLVGSDKIISYFRGLGE